jgi:hypothetical protein
MSRVVNLGTAVREAVEEVSDLIEDLSVDGAIDPSELPALLRGMSVALTKAEQAEVAMLLISCVASSGTESRRAKRHQKQFELLIGGLPDDRGAA